MRGVVGCELGQRSGFYKKSYEQLLRQRIKEKVLLLSKSGICGTQSMTLMLDHRYNIYSYCIRILRKTDSMVCVTFLQTTCTNGEKYRLILEGPALLTYKVFSEFCQSIPKKHRVAIQNDVIFDMIQMMQQLQTFTNSKEPFWGCWGVKVKN